MTIPLCNDIINPTKLAHGAATTKSMGELYMNVNEAVVSEIIVNETIIKKIKKFCVPYKKISGINKTFLCICVVFIFIPVFLLYLAYDKSKSVFDIFLTIKGPYIVLGILLLYLIAYRNSFLKHKRVFEKRLKYIKSKNALGSVIQDFMNGVKLFDGNLIVGEYCLIGKDYGLIVFYSEINKMYRDVSRTSDDDGKSDDDWFLCLRCSGKNYTLCNISDTRAGRANWRELKNFIELKDSLIKIT